MPSRTEQERTTWNSIKSKFPKGKTLGSRQVWILFCHIEYDGTRTSWSYGGKDFYNVEKSLVKRGLLETYGEYGTRITEKGLWDFIQNGGENAGWDWVNNQPSGIQKIKEFIVRNEWDKKDEWAKYLESRK